MMKRGGTLVLMIVSALMVLWSGCADEETSFVPSRVEATFGLNSRSAMAGKITIGEAFLKLDRIQVLGSLGGNNNTNVTHTIAADEPPYKLTMADSSQVNFNLASRVYDQLDFQLFLLQDGYQLTFTDAGPIEVPTPVEDNDDDSNGAEDGDQDDDEGNDNGQNDSDEDDSDDGEKDDNDEGDDDDDDADDDDENKDEDKDDDKKDKDDKDKNKNKNKNKNKGNKGNDDDHRGNNNGRTSEDKNQIVNLDHFFQNAKPGMAVFGIYENNGKVINIIFIASGIEKFTVRGKQKDAYAIELREDNTARVTFDPDRWFESITPAAIESARLQTYQQQTVLFVHKDYNTELFQLLAPRIEGSADMNITAGTGP